MHRLITICCESIGIVGKALKKRSSLILKYSASPHSLPRALACQNLEQSRGETRKQGFSAPIVNRRVKAVVFREARRKYFWLDFLVLFHQRKKNEEKKRSLPHFLLNIYCCLILSVTFNAQNSNPEDEYVNNNVLKYDDFTYNSNIKTVKFHESSWEYSAPLINLNGSEQLELSFDDMDGDQKQYSISFIHCNADWTPSDLRTSEYLTGFDELHLLNFAFSMNTFQKYTHYSITFPMANSQQNTQFTKSGNYLMFVYLDGDKNKLALCRRFMVYDSKAFITHTFRQSMGNGDQYNKQHIDFNISAGNYELTNPSRDLKVVMVQNNRWDNAVTDIKPTFMNGNQLVYSLDDATTFNGGNEFRFFDMRSLRFLTEKVKDIYKDKDLKNHVVLQYDEIRATKPYLFYNDINGSFLIKNREGLSTSELEADYVYVEFFLPYMKPESQGNFYIMGKLTDWRMNANSKMTYNELRNGYEKKLYLKQGYYNYNYVLSNDEKKGGDETVTEGNFWDTENDYIIYVYHRKFGGQYDQLIGVKKINSLKK